MLHVTGPKKHPTHSIVPLQPVNYGVWTAFTELADHPRTVNMLQTLIGTPQNQQPQAMTKGGRTGSQVEGRHDGRACHTSLLTGGQACCGL